MSLSTGNRPAIPIASLYTERVSSRQSITLLCAASSRPRQSLPHQAVLGKHYVQSVAVLPQWLPPIHWGLFPSLACLSLMRLLRQIE